MAGSGPAAAQEQPTPELNRAVLLSGPTPVKGIPVYAPNRIPCFQGVYVLEAEEGAGWEAGREEPAERPMQVQGIGGEAAAAHLRVLFSRQDLLVPRSWAVQRCGTRQLYRVVDHETFALCYYNERGFYLFFLFPDAEPPAYWCTFVDALIERFLYLLNFVKGDDSVPFPAVLQLD